MGKTVAHLVQDDPSLTIAASVGRKGSLSEAVETGEVVIDFSLAAATEAICAACVQRQRPLVLGSTGQNDAQMAAIHEAAEKVPVVASANFSVGVNLLFALTRKAANSLGKDFDVEIIEAHHRTKQDAPSGTARQLASILQSSLGKNPHVHSLRAGDIVGEHTVVFAGAGERIEMTHRASSREIFARGSLLAARWVVGQKPGLYGMSDVLGLRAGK